MSSAKYSNYFLILIHFIVFHSNAGYNLSGTKLTAVHFNENKQERTLVLLKPDCVQRGLIGKVIERFERRGLKLVAFKLIWARREIVEDHYAEHANQSFYPQLINFMTSGPIVPMVWEGLNAVKVSRQIMGLSGVDSAIPGTIRGDFSINRERNIIHGAHSIDEANREILLWFDENELVSWTPSNVHWIML